MVFDNNTWLLKTRPTFSLVERLKVTEDLNFTEVSYEFIYQQNYK